MSRLFLSGSTDQGENRARGWALFNNRTVSTSSLNSLASINTNLPQYCETDEPAAPSDLLSLRRPGSPTPSEITVLTVPLPSLQAATSCRNVPPRYSLLSQRHSRTVESLHSSHAGAHGQRKVSHHTEHSFPIRTNKPWATLLTFTPSSVPGLFQEPRVKLKLPRFLENEPISGMVELDLESSQSIQKISITLRGKMIFGYLAEQDYTFLDYPKVLWHKSMGNPPSPPTPSDRQAKISPGKLMGSYQIPFSFRFPNFVNLEPTLLSTASSTWSSSSDQKLPTASHPRRPILSHSEHDAGASFTSPPPGASSSMTSSSSTTSFSRYPVVLHPPDLKRNARALGHSSMPQSSTIWTNVDGGQSSISSTPQSFAEAGINVRVQYELTVHIVHGVFRPDSRIKAPVSYLPCITPPCTSIKRREAYENQALPPGPLSDPEGWFSLPKSVIRGQLGDKQVKIECTVYLATPLSYTRGTFIPCYLSLSGDDSNALNILCTPNMPHFRLVRHLRHFSLDDGDELSERILQHNEGDTSWSMGSFYGSILPSAAGSSKGGALKTVVTEMAKGVWWVPMKETPEEACTRNLRGEIHLAPDLQPSCACPIFQFEYFVEMLPFSSPVFQPILYTSGAPSQREAQSQALTAHPVQIATFYSAGGPPPAPFTNPPRSAKRNSSGTDVSSVNPSI